jgi:dihydrofolate reductase
MISIIAALGRNRELGAKNALLWQLPSDMKFFRTKTWDHPIIMGRKTYESILAHLKAPLPHRTTIVITKNARYNVPNGALVADSYEKAVAIAAQCEGGNEIFIGGGASLYSQALNTVDRMYLTHIDDASIKADAYFPKFHEEEFIVSVIGSYAENGVNFEIRQYDRIV